jgi:hypothetical protein
MPISDTIARDGVVGARRDDDHAVDEPAGEVFGHAVAVAVRVDDERHELVVGVGEHRVRAEQDAADVGVFEEERVRLVHDEPDRVRLPRDEVARRGVAHVADLHDRVLDRLLRGIRDVGLGVEHARDRAARDAGDPRDIVDRRSRGVDSAGDHPHTLLPA